MRKLLAPAAVAVICLAVLLTALPSLASRDGGGAGGTAFPANLNVQDDDCGHDPFIWQQDPPPHNLTLNVVTQGPLISIFGPSPWVEVHGEFVSGNQFVASGTGTVAGFPNVTVQMQGTWDDSTLTGKYEMGANDELPPCDDDGIPGTPPQAHPAVYSIKPKATPTPTATPPDEKSYSIIVIKLDDDTLEPLADWEFNLFAGPDCNGPHIDSGFTDEDGILDFLGLEPGTYSVEEKLEPGWNPVTDICQDVAAGAAGSPAGLPPCPIQPDAEHPQPGCDSFLSAARVVIRNNATGDRAGVSLGGPTLITRLNKPSDKDGDGLDEINTELVAMELTGGGVTVVQSPIDESLGKIEEQVNVVPGVLDFPANSYFDVFFEVEVPGMGTLHNDVPFRIECKIEEIPPFLCFYLPVVSTPIVLDDDNEVKRATLLHGMHIPIPPKESVVIFANARKATPTRTPTSAGTATRTPTSAGTATPTATPTNPPPNGGCEKQEQEAPFQGTTWELWKCQPANPTLPFNRVDLSVGSATQELKLDPEFPPRFVCQTTQEKAIGVFKVRKKNVNPGTALPHNEVWSAEFEVKCQEGVQVYLRPRLPANHPVINAVAFTNVGPPEPVGTPTATRPATTAPPTATRTPTPATAKPLGDVNDDGAVNSLDALLILQLTADLLDELLNPASSDVDDDGDTDSIDALIVLQVDAGLLDLMAVGGASQPFGPLW